MKIQWFPGHMTKALREMEENVKKVDLIIYVLDARAPVSCVNPEFLSIIGNKPVIYILNKVDLADDNKTKYFTEYFKKDNCLVLPLVSTMNTAVKQVIQAMQNLLSTKLERNKQKGITMPLRAMVIGVPNCGKSTLINSLCGKYKAKTGDKPSITRSTQWVKVAGDIEVLDTPGTLWPNFEDDNIAHNLAYINSIKDDILDVSELALDFITKLTKDYPQFLIDRYNINVVDEMMPIDYLQQICENRKFMLRGGDFDWERGSRALLDDFRKGRLGKITLD